MLLFLFILPSFFLYFFFFNDTATTEIYTLSLHDALPIYPRSTGTESAHPVGAGMRRGHDRHDGDAARRARGFDPEKVHQFFTDRGREPTQEMRVAGDSPEPVGPGDAAFQQLEFVLRCGHALSQFGEERSEERILQRLGRRGGQRGGLPRPLAIVIGTREDQPVSSFRAAGAGTLRSLRPNRSVDCAKPTTREHRPANASAVPAMTPVSRTGVCANTPIGFNAAPSQSRKSANSNTPSVPTPATPNARPRIPALDAPAARFARQSAATKPQKKRSWPRPDVNARISFTSAAGRTTISATRAG